MQHDNEEVPIISRYTRAQAIEDGVLVDLTEWARETGFRFPVACTIGVWSECIQPPAAVPEQSERGRAHDLLWMLYLAIRAATPGDRLAFEVAFSDGPSQRRIAKLQAICGPGDEGEPVITVLLPHED